MDQPLTRAPERFLFTRWWWSEVMMVAFLGLIFLLSVLSDPSSEAIRIFGAEVPDLCLFKRLTGYRCPGCGLTRAFSFMAEGQVWSAFRMHILGPPIFLAMLYQLFYSAARLFRGPRWIPPWRRWWRSRRRRR